MRMKPNRNYSERGGGGRRPRRRNDGPALNRRDAERDHLAAPPAGADPLAYAADVYADAATRYGWTPGAPVADPLAEAITAAIPPMPFGIVYASDLDPETAAALIPGGVVPLPDGKTYAAALTDEEMTPRAEYALPGYILIVCAKCGNADYVGVPPVSWRFPVPCNMTDDEASPFYCPGKMYPATAEQVAADAERAWVERCRWEALNIIEEPKRIRERSERAAPYTNCPRDGRGYPFSAWNERDAYERDTPTLRQWRAEDAERRAAEGAPSDD